MSKQYDIENFRGFFFPESYGFGKWQKLMVEIAIMNEFRGKNPKLFDISFFSKAVG